MKRLIIITIVLFLTANLYAQQTRYTQDDTSKHYYSKTDFTEIDTLEFWKFNIDRSSELTKNDSINPIGTVRFWRTVSIDDSISIKVYDKLWTPNISYSIYNVKDSIYCKKVSERVRFFSSCVPPDVGGDYIVLGEFILLNTSVCLQCGRYYTGLDYCRPILNSIIKQIDIEKIKSIDSIEAEIGKMIKKE